MSVSVDQYWLAQDDAAELRAAVAVLRRRSAKPRSYVLRFVTKVLETAASWLESQA